MSESVRVLLPEDEVDKRISEIGRQISEAYKGKHVHLICVLKGGVCFTCELAKRITVPVCTLLDKPSRRVKDVKVDYVGFSIPDEFVVGYGLDYDQKYRNLPYIGVVEFDD